MNELSFKAFVYAMIFGAGFHLGWGAISLLFWLGSKALSVDAPI